MAMLVHAVTAREMLKINWLEFAVHLYNLPCFVSTNSQRVRYTSSNKLNQWNNTVLTPAVSPIDSVFLSCSCHPQNYPGFGKAPFAVSFWSPIEVHVCLNIDSACTRLADTDFEATSLGRWLPCSIYGPWNEEIDGGATGYVPESWTL